MNKTKLVLFAVALLAMLFSCSDGNSASDGSGNDNYGMGDGGNIMLSSSSSVYQGGSSSSQASGSSSSNGGLSSSSSAITVYTFSYNGKTYKYVQIGEQFWMTEDIIPTSTIWAIIWNDACPKGWHLPNDDEWIALKIYIETANSCSNCDAKYLKATSEWSPNGTGNGINAYGFNALPNKVIDDDGNGFGCWWSFSNDVNTGHRVQTMNGNYEYDNSQLYDGNGLKTDVCNVRCLRDKEISSSSSSLPSSSSSFVPIECSSYNSSTHFCDTREGKIYKYVSIGEQTWMAENLNYNAEGSKCYNNQDSYCSTYGRLYDWATAMALPSGCNNYNNDCSSQINAKHRGICPNGWHVPNYNEWPALTSFVREEHNNCTNCDAKYLKATSGWNDSGNGFDSYGFAALPGGLYYSLAGFVGVGNYGYWWSTYGIVDEAYSRYMEYNDNNTIYVRYYKDHLHSVRCLKD